MKDNSKGLLYAGLTASLWGFLAIALKVAVTSLSPVTVVWFRFTTAFLILAILTFIFKKSDFSIFRKPPWLLILAAFFLGLNYLGFISGIKYVSPSSSQIFIMIAPVTFALSGIVLFKEQVNWRHIIGFCLVIAGILIFYSEQLANLTDKSNHFTRGMLLIIAAGLSWTVFASLQKSLVRRYTPNQLNLFIYSLCSLFLFPFARFSEIGVLTSGDLVLLTYLGFNTVLAYGSLALAIKYTEANKVSVIITMNPIITFVSMAILGKMKVSWIEPESFSLISLVGALIVLFGTMLVILAGNRKKLSKVNRKF